MPRILAVIATAAAMALTSTATAQTAEGIWQIDGQTLRAPLAQIAFPTAIPGLKLTETKEFSQKGQKLDNVAEYRSPDKALWASIYVYRPGYPDAALAAYATDRTMPQVYGAGLHRLAQASVALGGRPDTAIRMSYTGGIIKDSGPLASVSSFTRIGGWIVKIRVSGPAARQPEVETALDAMLGAARLDAKAAIFRAQPLRFDPPCPAGASGPVATVKPSEDLTANTLGSAMVVAAAGLSNETPGNDKLPADFPANGMTAVCVRGALALGGGSKLEVLQPAGTATPDVMLVVLNDVDDVLSIRKTPIGTGFTLTKTDIGKGTTLGTIDRMPDDGELARIAANQVPGALTVHATTTLSADGSTNISISTDKK